MIFVRKNCIFRHVISWSVHLSQVLRNPKSLPLKIFIFIRVEYVSLLKFVFWLTYLLNTWKCCILFTRWNYISLILIHIDFKLLLRIEILKDLNSKLMIFNSRPYRQYRVPIFVSHVAGKSLLFDMNLVRINRGRLFLNYNRCLSLLNRCMFGSLRCHRTVLRLMIPVAVHLSWCLLLLLE